LEADLNIRRAALIPRRAAGAGSALVVSRTKGIRESSQRRPRLTA
jgi:hypothetical protein